MDLQNLSDAELMAQTRRGRHDAFAVLIRRYQRSLVNFFRRMGALHHEAEDLVQETFVRVYSHRKRYAPTGKFSSFLYVVARHAWADMLRRASRRPEAKGRTDAEASVGGGTDRSDARMDVQAALERLSEKLRVVVVLSVYQGLRYREIAEVLDIPLGTVKSRMHLALRQMEEFLNVGE